MRSNLIILLKALLIVASGTLVLYPLLGSSWYGDDDLYLTVNPLLQDPHRLWKAWFEPGSFIEYYPIDQTVEYFQWRLWGTGSAYPYHVTNLVLHLTSALLLWRLLAKLGLKLAWIGGLIFAVHPVLADSIAGANELKSTLSLPPFLLAISFYLDFEQGGHPRDYWRALGLFLIAMLCKITMAFFPAVILLYAWWKRGRVTWSDVRAALPFLIISLVLIWTTLHAGDVYADATHYKSPAAIHLGGPLERIALAGMSLSFYLGRAFFPIHPLPMYPLWSMEPLTLWHFLPLLAFAVIVICCWRLRESWGRPILFGLGFFVLGLAPFLGLNETSYMALLWVSDHLLYIPILAPIALVVAGLDLLARRLPPRWVGFETAIAVLAAGLLGLQTWTFSRLFIDPSALWIYDAQYNPTSWFPPFRLGVLAYSANKTDEAIQYLQQSARLNPKFTMTHYFLGVELCNRSRFVEGIDEFRKAVETQPDNYRACLYLGLALLREGRTADAIAALTKSLKGGDSIQIRGALSSAYAKAKRYPEAMEQIEAALRLDPENPNLEQQYLSIQQQQNAAMLAPAPKPPPPAAK